MIQHSQFTAELSRTPWLYFNELLHRVNNQYASAISFASLVAARSSNQEAREAVGAVINHLLALAAVQRAMRPSSIKAPADFAEHLTKLCRAMVSAGLEQRGIALHLVVSEPILLDGERCWRAGLVVSELITNATRHAFASRAGCISVAVTKVSGRAICRVSDDGSPAATFEPGLGSRLVNALAAELDGYVKRQFGPCGTTTTLCFPLNPESVATPPGRQTRSGQSRPGNTDRSFSALAVERWLSTSFIEAIEITWKALGFTRGEPGATDPGRCQLPA